MSDSLIPPGDARPMNCPDERPDERLPDYRARVRRRQRAHPIGARRRRKLAGRRIGVLASAIAVPALASPGHFQFAGQEAALAAPVVQPMGFETPGESFPGSAFYYLEDAPEALAPADTAAGEPARSALEGSALAESARPLRLSGSARDHARAQQCLTMAIYYEAASESDAGQRAVAQVVLNRVAHPSFPATVCGVVFEGSERSTGCQFSFTCDGSLARRPASAFWTRAVRIARQALAGAIYQPVGLATHYHTLAVKPHWAPGLDRVTAIGAHQFYRWPGAAGTRAAFTASYAGGEPPAQRRRGDADSAGPATGPAEPAAVLPAMPPAPEPLPAAQPEPVTDSRLPQGGGVRAEYSDSGKWRGDTAAP